MEAQRGLKGPLQRGTGGACGWNWVRTHLQLPLFTNKESGVQGRSLGNNALHLNKPDPQCHKVCVSTYLSLWRPLRGQGWFHHLAGPALSCSIVSGTAAPATFLLRNCTINVFLWKPKCCLGWKEKMPSSWKFPVENLELRLIKKRKLFCVYLYHLWQNVFPFIVSNLLKRESLI